MKKKLFKHRRSLKTKKKVHVEVNEVDERGEAAVDGGDDEMNKDEVQVEAGGEKNVDRAVDEADAQIKEVDDAAGEENRGEAAAVDEADAQMKEVDDAAGEDKRGEAAAVDEADAQMKDVDEAAREDKTAEATAVDVSVEGGDIFNGVVNQVLVNLNEQFPIEDDVND